MPATADHLLPTPLDTLKDSLSRGVTGKLWRGGSRGGGREIYVMQGQVLAAHGPDDGPWVVRRLVNTGALTERQGKAFIRRLTRGTPFDELILGHVPDSLLETLLAGRFRQNLLDFLSTPPPIQFQPMDTLFVPNLQPGHDTRTLLTAIVRLRERIGPLMRHRGPLTLRPGPSMPASRDEARLVDLCDPPLSLRDLLTFSPFETGDTLDHVLQLLTSGALVSDEGIRLAQTRGHGPTSDYAVEELFALEVPHAPAATGHLAPPIPPDFVALLRETSEASEDADFGEPPQAFLSAPMQTTDDFPTDSSHLKLVEDLPPDAIVNALSEPPPAIPTPSLLPEAGPSLIPVSHGPTANLDSDEGLGGSLLSTNAPSLLDSVPGGLSSLKTHPTPPPVHVPSDASDRAPAEAVDAPHPLAVSDSSFAMAGEDSSFDLDEDDPKHLIPSGVQSVEVQWAGDDAFEPTADHAAEVAAAEVAAAEAAEAAEVAAAEAAAAEAAEVAAAEAAAAEAAEVAAAEVAAAEAAAAEVAAAEVAAAEAAAAEVAAAEAAAAEVAAAEAAAAEVAAAEAAAAEAAEAAEAAAAEAAAAEAAAAEAAAAEAAAAEAAATEAAAAEAAAAEAAAAEVAAAEAAAVEAAATEAAAAEAAAAEAAAAEVAAAEAAAVEAAAAEAAAAEAAAAEVAAAEAAAAEAAAAEVAAAEAAAAAAEVAAYDDAEGVGQPPAAPSSSPPAIIRPPTDAPVPQPIASLQGSPPPPASRTAISDEEAALFGIGGLVDIIAPESAAEDAPSPPFFPPPPSAGKEAVLEAPVRDAPVLDEPDLQAASTPSKPDVLAAARRYLEQANARRKDAARKSPEPEPQVVQVSQGEKKFTGFDFDVEDDELGLFEDHDRYRGAGQGQFTLSKKLLDKVDLRVERPRTSLHDDDDDDDDDIIEMGEATAEEEEAAGVVALAFSAPQLDADRALQKIAVGADVALAVARQLDLLVGPGAGQTAVQLLVESAAGNYSRLFHEVEVSKHGRINERQVLANLQRRPKTEQRFLLDRGVMDFIERALSTGAEDLSDDALDALLEEIAGYQQRLRM